MRLNSATLRIWLFLFLVGFASASCDGCPPPPPPRADAGHDASQWRDATSGMLDGTGLDRMTADTGVGGADSATRTDLGAWTDSSASDGSPGISDSGKASDWPTSLPPLDSGPESADSAAGSEARDSLGSGTPDTPAANPDSRSEVGDSPVSGTPDTPAANPDSRSEAGDSPVSGTPDTPATNPDSGTETDAPTGDDGLPGGAPDVSAADSATIGSVDASAPGEAGFSTSNVYVLEDFSDIVTVNDLGLDDFSGNMGAINSNSGNFGTTALATSDGHPRLQFVWDFASGSSESFTGMFFSLFGLTDTLVTFDGSKVETVRFPEHTLNLNQIDGDMSDESGPRRFLKLAIELEYSGTDDLDLRLELKNPDPQTGSSTGRFRRFRVKGNAGSQTLGWDFRDPASFAPLAAGDLDLTAAKVLTLIVERQHVADGIRNPDTGTLWIRRVFFESDRGDSPTDEQKLLELAERRSVQYFLDWASRKPSSLGLPQDRSTFADLLTVGGVGFALPAYAIAAKRTWLGRQDAAARVLAVLRLLDDATLLGREATGRLGYKGIFYHFLGVDGRRKLNFDYPDTKDVDEARNTVELSTIDTTLAVWGVLVAQSYFDGTSADEVEIRSRAQSIYDRVDWLFLQEPTSKQLYLGWKPNEQRDETTAAFQIPDAEGLGSYSGKAGSALTLDYYTDEALLAVLLGVGSQTHPITRDSYCALIRYRASGDSLVRTWPGALFTYQFLHAFLNTSDLGFSACPGLASDDWYANSQAAQSRAVTYAEAAAGKPAGFGTYGPAAWGITAADSPDDRYRADGALTLAASPTPEGDGTIAYYGMLSAVTFGSDLRAKAIAALRAGWERGHWHPRFGLPDAFHSDVSRVPTSNKTVRSSGHWVNRALFAIDQGPMALALANDRDGLVWNLSAKNPNVQRAISLLRKSFAPAAVFSLEGEAASGDGGKMGREHASGRETRWLHAGETASWSFTAPAAGRYGITAAYSNDNFGSLEKVQFLLDGTPAGAFDAQDTGDIGAGWDVFLTTGSLAVVDVAEGTHTLAVQVSGGDGYGVEIDVVRLALTP
jgi:hypothetical protein